MCILSSLVKHHRTSHATEQNFFRCFRLCKHFLYHSVIGYLSVAVSVVNVHGSITTEVQLKNIAVAMVPPPGAQLSVPGTVKVAEELRMLHAYHGKEVLITQVTPEVIFLGEVGNMFRLKQAVVECRAAHGVQIQQHHTAVEARKTIRRGVTHTGLGVFLAVLPEGVSEGERKHKNKISVDNAGSLLSFSGNMSTPV